MGPHACVYIFNDFAAATDPPSRRARRPMLIDARRWTLVRIFVTALTRWSPVVGRPFRAGGAAAGLKTRPTASGATCSQG